MNGTRRSSATSRGVRNRRATCRRVDSRFTAPDFDRLRRPSDGNGNDGGRRRIALAAGAWILIYVINKQSFGWTIEFHAPVRLIALSLLMTFLASLLAGIFPAGLASRINPAARLMAE